MSCIPRGIRKEKKKKEQNDIELFSERKLTKRGLSGCLTDGKNWSEFNQIDQFRG